MFCLVNQRLEVQFPTSPEPLAVEPYHIIHTKTINSPGPVLVTAQEIHKKLRTESVESASFLGQTSKNWLN